MKAANKSFIYALSLLMTIPLLGSIYIGLNHEAETTHSLVTDMDNQLPFFKVFVLPYLGWYLFIVCGFVFLAWNNRKVYYETLLQYNLGLLVCYGIYAVYQTHVPRPELMGDDWLSRLVEWVYVSDNPYNCFPSIHVLTTYVIMKGFAGTPGIGVGVKWLVAIPGLLIIASTLFVKQHVLLDLVGAVAVAETIRFAMKYWQRVKSTKSLLPPLQPGTVEKGI